jgi:phage replication-related protein YjqB (UPF0714/DUF867 family)
MQRTTTAAAYDARILRLRLPEQDSLKNEAERCSADAVSLASIGRAVRQQVRIKRTDDADFVAVYTVSQPNPDDPSRADVVRTGLAGRERLGTSGELDKVAVEATVVDATPSPTGVRFFEVAEDTGDQSYFVVIAPHGGKIEDPTDEQAIEVMSRLRTAGFPTSLWLCKGFGDNTKGASDRWHITSTDIHPASFPLLGSLMSRQFFYGVAFHGFARQEGEADIYIGGAARPGLKAAVQRALNRLGLQLEIKISTRADSPKFQGFSPENVINRLAANGIHLEQSKEARVFHKEIAGAVADVFASPWRWLVWALTSFFR